MRSAPPHPGRRLGLTLAATRNLLDALARTYDPAFLDTDPLGIVRRYSDPSDREIAALLGAALAYGRVVSVRKSLERILAAMGPSPGRFVDRFDARAGRNPFEGFVHRFTTGRDVAELLDRVRRAREASGSLEAFFLAGDPDPDGPTLAPAMAAFVDRLFALGTRTLPRRDGARWLLPSPSSGSLAKRHCLFLRWVVRPEDGIDLGVWTRVSPARLVLPVDVHLFRVVTALGWTRRRSPTFALALEATDALRRLDPRDPTRYDFALSRLGILGLLPAPGGRLDRRRLAAAMGA